MMVNLFSIFDPTSSILSNWISMILVLMLLPQMFWLSSNSFMFAIKSVSKNIYEEFKLLVMTPSSNMIINMFVIILIMIALNNFLGLMPYTFTATSHLSYSLSMSLPIWVGLMLFGWINQTKHMLAHLVPQSTPPMLMPFMVLIESISNMIRPLTLAVRLTANMIAGHLLMTLLGNQAANSFNIYSMTPLIITQMTLLTLESAVALIQSYVFTVLATLYTSELSFDN